MREIDALRVRLGRADQDGRKAWSELSAMIRQVINAEAEGATVRDALDAIQQRHAVIAAAIAELRNVETGLIRLARAAPRELAVDPPRSMQDAIPCAACGRSDAIVQVRICARCSGMGSF